MPCADRSKWLSSTNRIATIALGLMATTAVSERPATHDCPIDLLTELSLAVGQLCDHNRVDRSLSRVRPEKQPPHPGDVRSGQCIRPDRYILTYFPIERGSVRAIRHRDCILLRSDA